MAHSRKKRNATLGGPGGAGERRGPRCWARPGPPRCPPSIRARWRPIRRPCAHLWTAERRKQELARMHAGQSGHNLAGFRRRAGGYAPFAPAGAPLSNPPRCWPIRPSTRRVGDAKSGRIASILKMLAERPRSATIGKRSDEGCDGSMAHEAGGYRWGVEGSVEDVLPARCDAALMLG